MKFTENDDFAPRISTITIELSLSGLQRKFIEYKQRGGRGHMRRFIRKAIKGFTNIEMEKKLLNGNYETLDLTDALKAKKLRGERLTMDDLIENNIAEYNLDDINYMVYNLIEYKTIDWLEKIQNRSRHGGERKLIQKFQ